MTDLTFTINGNDYADLVEKGEYSTSQVPVIGAQYTDLNKVTHTSIVRHRGVLKVKLNPAKRSRIIALCSDLRSAPLTVQYYSFQTGSIVTQTMLPDETTMQDAFTLASERWNTTNEITFTEE